MSLSAAFWAAGSAVSAAQAGKAHEHGVARLDIGVEAGRVTVDLELPLEDLVGFARAPRTDAERAAVTKALGRLQEAAGLVRIDAAAGCGLGKVELTAPLWGVGGEAAPAAGGASAPSTPSSAAAAAGRPSTATASAPRPAAAARPQDRHGDLEASYEFRCSNAPAAAFVEVALFDAFARLRRIEVQAVTPRGQMKAVLRRPQARVTLAR
jgi:hypothetical protein